MAKEDNLKPAWNKGESGNPNELWGKIPNYEDYYISNFGNVKSIKNNKEKLLAIQGCSKRNGVYRYNSIKLSKNGISKRVRIHQLIAIAFLNHDINNSNIIVDHINNNGLDNRLENLQLITKRQNQQKDKKPISGYTGVSFCKNRNKWRSRIVVNKKEIHIGYFENPLLAKTAYNNYINNENIT
jgi:hypothetical protein